MNYKPDEQLYFIIVLPLFLKTFSSLFSRDNQAQKANAPNVKNKANRSTHNWPFSNQAPIIIIPNADNIKQNANTVKNVFITFI